MVDVQRRWASFFAGTAHESAGPRAGWLILLLMSASLFGVRLGQPLLEPEEARYAEIPRQMLAEGRFLTPVLHGEPYLQKPPLLYWLVMLSYTLFGVGDMSARLVPVVAGILTILVTAWWGSRTLGSWGGFVSGVILCLSGRFLYLAGMLTMDGLLTCCVVSALAFGHRTLAERRRAWLIVASLALALGILTKGPVALVLVLGPLAAALWLDPRLSLPSWRDGLLSMGILGMVAGPWYLASMLSAPEATGTFFWLHNIVRYLAPFDHEQPAWVYLPSLILGALPWTLLVIPAWSYLIRSTPRLARRRPAGLGVFFICWLACVGFFSMSGCKRPAYILPAFPLFALISASYLTHGLAWSRWQIPFAKGAVLLFGILILASSFALPCYQKQFTLRHTVAPEQEVAQDLPIVSYPKRYDSISFYLQRDVTAFTPAQKSSLAKNWVEQGRTLVFVRREGEALRDLLETLPDNWEFIPRGEQKSKLMAGIVGPRHGTP